MITIFDPLTGDPREVAGIVVSCSTPGCVNEGTGVEVADDPLVCVQCGPCGRWIIPPAPPAEPDEPAELDEPEEEP